MLKGKGSLNEEIPIKLTRRDVLLMMLCINITSNHTDGESLLYDLECLREKLASRSGLAIYSAS